MGSRLSRPLIGLAPLLAAGSLAVLALTPGPVVAGAALAVGGLVNGAMTRATIGIVNGLPPRAVPGGLAELTVAAVSAPLFVGLVIGVASAAGIAPRAIMAGHAVFVACAAIVTLNGARQLPAGTGRRPPDMERGLLAVGSAALLSVAMPLIGIGAWGWIGLLMSASRPLAIRVRPARRFRARTSRPRRLARCSPESALR